MAVLRLPPARPGPLQGREGRHAQGRRARPGVPGVVTGAEYSQGEKFLLLYPLLECVEYLHISLILGRVPDVRPGPGAARGRRRVQEAGAGGRPLLRVRRLHHGRARLPDAQGHHPGAGRHDGRPGRALHAQAAGERCTPAP